MYKKYIKRLLDIIFSLLGLIIASPIFLIISILVFVFMGHPVIFKQQRPGKNGKIFNLYKFRTMTNKKDKDGNLLPDEKRLTKFGKFLRSTSLDEIPEFINILIGKMSFIGPRPMLVRDMVFFSEKTMKRQSVTPGLTGLAQVNGRNSINWEDRFKYDLEYVDKISFKMDLKIIFLTIKTVLSRSGIGEDETDLSIDYGDYLLKYKKITKKEYNKKQQEAKDLLNGIVCHKEKGLVSIIMPSYNTGKYIEKSIKSVLAQTYKNWELIIVDDCSTDDTEKIIKKYLKDKRINYYKNEKNSGAAVSRNKALSLAKGEYVAFLDSDDLWDKNKLKKQIKFMEENKIAFSYTDYQIQLNGKWLPYINTAPNKVTKHKMNNYCYFSTITVMYNSELVGNIQIKPIKKNNDYALWLKIIKKAPAYRLPECLSYYIKHDGSISSGSKWKLIKYHYILWKDTEGKNSIVAFLYTIRNLFFGVFKKLTYKKKLKEGKKYVNI